MKDEIRDVISGKSQVRYGANIQTTLNYLKKSEGTSTLDKTNKYFKLEETKRLIKYVENQNFWVREINLNNYVSEGAEQKVYTMKMY